MGATEIIVALLSVIGVALGGIATYRSSVRSKEIESEGPYIEVLAKRVTDLERADQDKGKRLYKLERRFRIVSEALATQHRWQLAGAKPPPPPIPLLAIEIISREDLINDHPDH